MGSLFQKIKKNTEYGEFISDRFFLFDPQLAERITKEGQKNIRKIKTKTNGKK